MNINQFVAQGTGISRRSAEAEVRAGKVRLNGKKAVLGAVVDPAKDKVEYMGLIVHAVATAHTTIALHKPVGYITSKAKDETGTPTVMDLLPKDLHHLKPVGRLDKDSEGLLLLTDDGNLLYRMTHPKFATAKEYLVEFADDVSDTLIVRWKKGIRLPDGVARADSVERKGRKKLAVVIHQGLNRQLRRMAGKSGAAVTRLVRVRVGTVALGKEKPGTWRKVSV